METNQAANSWAAAQTQAKREAATLVIGSYWHRWSEEDPHEQLTAEVRRALAGRGLTLVSDDRGLRVAVGDGAIRALRDEAAQAGDDAQVRMCDRALDGDEAAWRKCERAIRDAQAMGER